MGAGPGIENENFHGESDRFASVRAGLMRAIFCGLKLYSAASFKFFLPQLIVQSAVFELDFNLFDRDPTPHLNQLSSISIKTSSNY